MRIALLLIPLLTTACAGTADAPPPGPLAPHFSAITFFTGRTEGNGTLRKILSAPKKVQVLGIGHLGPNGTLVLDQLVEEAGKAPRRRQWRIRETAPNRYSGSLTDAQGLVTGEVARNLFRLRFRMKGGLDAQQWLTLHADGRTVSNRMIVSKFGIRIATLDEVIRKTG